MKKIFNAPVFLLCTVIFFSCAGRRNTADIHHVQDEDFYETEIARNAGMTINAGNITETKEGTIPQWFLAYLNGGIRSVENLDSFRDKYVFIGENRGENSTALNKWAEYYSPVQDFPMLAGARIERKIFLSSNYYPDDVYGLFFERMIVYAYSIEYPGAEKEDTFWIKTETDGIQTNYFFILVTVNKSIMQNVVYSMMSKAVHETPQSEAQTASINRLRQTFFEGF